MSLHWRVRHAVRARVSVCEQTQTCTQLTVLYFECISVCADTTSCVHTHKICTQPLVYTHNILGMCGCVLIQQSWRAACSPSASAASSLGDPPAPAVGSEPTVRPYPVRSCPARSAVCSQPGPSHVGRDAVGNSRGSRPGRLRHPRPWSSPPPSLPRPGPSPGWYDPALCC